MNDEPPANPKSPTSDGAKRRRQRRSSPKKRAPNAPTSNPSKSPGDNTDRPKTREASQRRDSASGHKNKRSRDGRARGPRDSKQRRHQSQTNRRNSPTSPRRSEPTTPPQPSLADKPILKADALPTQTVRADSARRRDLQWGDDRDAPTPEIPHSSQLPDDPVRDDLDPTSAYLLADSTESTGPLNARIYNRVGVRFSVAGKIYFYDAGDAIFDRGDRVVIDHEQGERIATVAVIKNRGPHPQPLQKIVRPAPPDDPAHNEQATLQRNRDLLVKAKREARKLHLPIKVFRTAIENGGKKLAIYYSSETKTDVRRLSQAISKQVSYHVDLRHTGVRDQAKLVGGIGSCGQELCCSTWLPAFVPVSIKNAKDQGLILNPSKVSGQCGRLKCCLVYEQDHYSELRKGLPKLGKRVITSDGLEGKVIEVDVLHQRIRVGIGRGNSNTYAKDEIKPMFPSQPTGRQVKNK